jgi:hypothetical protein
MGTDEVRRVAVPMLGMAEALAALGRFLGCGGTTAQWPPNSLRGRRLWSMRSALAVP